MATSAVYESAGMWLCKLRGLPSPLMRVKEPASVWVLLDRKLPQLSELQRGVFFIESQMVYVTNLYDNLGCPSNNSRFRNVVSRSPIYTHKKLWVILEI